MKAIFLTVTFFLTFQLNSEHVYDVNSLLDKYDDKGNYILVEDLSIDRNKEGDVVFVFSIENRLENETISQVVSLASVDDTPFFQAYPCKVSLGEFVITQKEELLNQVYNEIILRPKNQSHFNRVNVLVSVTPEVFRQLLVEYQKSKKDLVFWFEFGIIDSIKERTTAKAVVPMNWLLEAIGREEDE